MSVIQGIVKYNPPHSRSSVLRFFSSYLSSSIKQTLKHNPSLYTAHRLKHSRASKITIPSPSTSAAHSQVPGRVGSNVIPTIVKPPHDKYKRKPYIYMVGVDGSAHSFRALTAAKNMLNPDTNDQLIVTHITHRMELPQKTKTTAAGASSTTDSKMSVSSAARLQHDRYTNELNQVTDIQSNEEKQLEASDADADSNISIINTALHPRRKPERDSLYAELKHLEEEIYYRVITSSHVPRENYKWLLVESDMDMDLRDKMLSLVSEYSVDFLFVGRRGQSYANKLSMGGVAKYMLDHANTNVVLVK